ncbi:MAG: hypothetical protein M0Z33_03835 [Actinomycetota bacterium]|nr:hypothetical protein [Actinomycetota bacterium]
MSISGHRGEAHGAQTAGGGRGAPVADLRNDRLTGATSLVVPPWSTAKAANPAVVALELPVGTVPCPFCPVAIDDGTHSAGEETGRVPGGARHPLWSSVSLRNRWPQTVAVDAAEVVVLSDVHDAHLGDLDLDEASAAMGLLLRRAESQRRAGRFPLVFVNHGVNAGSSQPHPHGQVVGLPEADPGSRREAEALGAGSCVLCEELPGELTVARVPGATVVVPEAPTVDYDQTVVLDGHGPATARAVAHGVQAALRALYAVTGPVAYNLVVHESGHAHVHVVPRTGWHSGYELAGVHTCYVDPAVAAERLRAASETLARRSRPHEAGLAFDPEGDAA